ncbi:MAG: hypothetical protein JO266_14240 [Acidobacteria bacterium]|nr:hypothetical protein [Acidobacteriota bacterium]MBV9480614.1 hypothetical protein [Acidobacteriota bacterium]
MKSVVENLSTGANWPPAAGEIINFHTNVGVRSGTLKEIRWGLLWRDFILEDGRVIAEQKVLGAPESPVWREPTDISKEEQQTWEERLVAMATSGLDPHDRESPFWAALMQYLAYTYLRFQRITSSRPP